MAVAIQANGKKLFIDPMPGKKLSFLIQQAGIPLDLQCSGLGICRKCQVELRSGKYRIHNKVVAVEPASPLAALACQTEVLSENASLFVPQTAILKTEGKIYDEFQLGDFTFDPMTKKFFISLPQPTLDNPVADLDRTKREILKLCDESIDIEMITCNLEILQKLPYVLDKSDSFTVTVSQFQKHCHIMDIQEGNTTHSNLAAAVDIGTTTVALLLVDLNTGDILARSSCYNQQMSRADDVASRISVASQSLEMLHYMKDLVINDTINILIKHVCEDYGCNPHDIMRLAVSGNTVMAHLFLGLSPERIGTIPFQPVTKLYQDCCSRCLGVNIHPFGVVSIVPSVSGYIGGDITSDIYSTRLAQTHDLSAMIDLGTNSEMVLADKGELFACAAAAGPAFEGAGIMCGCRATDGAIEHIRFDEKLDIALDIIGDSKPIGICGSAIIDFIANGFRSGLINSMGRYDVDMLKRSQRYLHADVASGQSHACVLVDAEASGVGKPIVVTEPDIEQILKAKAAVYAGLRTLLSERGYTFRDLKRIILAGGFAKYIDIDNAVCIGMLPENAPEIIDVIGNGSLAGAYLSLLDPVASESYEEIIGIPKIVPLNTIPGFEMNFVDSLLIPHFDENEFPQLQALLNTQ